ncbi:MAG: STT3 domain-containing protein [archaeon]
MAKSGSDEEEVLTIDFGKIKKFFGGKKSSRGEQEGKPHGGSARPPAEKKKPDEDISIDWRSAGKFLSQHGTAFLILIPLMLAIFTRIQPLSLPMTDDWATNSVHQYYRSQVANIINQQYPNLPAENKDALITKDFQKILEEQKPQIEEQIKQSSDYFKSRLRDESGQTYLLAIDPFFWVRHAENVLANGHPGDKLVDGKPYDDHMYAPVGKFIPADMFHAYFEAFLYKVVKIFNPDVRIKNVAFYIPVLLSALCVIPAFFIVRRIAGNVGGFFAAVMVAVQPAFIGRTAAGFADTDAYNVLFPLMIMWVFLESFEAKKISRVAILGVLAGFLSGLYSLTWTGWWHIFDFIFIAMVAYIAYYMVIHMGLIRKGPAQLFRNPVIRHILLASLLFFVSSAVFITFFRDAGTFSLAFTGAWGFTKFKEVAVTTVWPNVMTTVAEQNPSTLESVINSVGGRFFFFLAIVGIFLSLLKKDIHGNRDIKYFFLIGIYFASTAFAAVRGIRFALMFIPAFSLAFGVFAGFVYNYGTRLGDREFKIGKTISKVVLILILTWLVVKPVNSGFYTGRQEIPSMNDAWYTALDMINKLAAPDAIINSWWDFGHWFKYIGDRAVTFDGTSQNSPQAHWIGKVLYTDDEDVAVGILRMLDCGANGAYERIIKVTNSPVKSVDIINTIIVMDRESARSYLKSIFSDEQAEDILKVTHCDPPEDYFIASDDMVGKSGVWSHFGSWDFWRASMYQKVKKTQPAAGLRILTEEFNLSEDEADTVYYEIKTQDANNWISGWPGYASGLSSCSKQDNIVTCGNGLQVNVMDYNATIPTPNGVLRPKEFGYGTSLGYHTKSYDESTVPYGAHLVKRGKDSYYSVMMSPELTSSMFTRLFYGEGHALTHFKLFTHQKSVFGGDIYVYKVDWNGTEKIILDAYTPKSAVSPGDTVSVDYIGWTEDGEVFDSNIINWRTRGVTNETQFSDDLRTTEFKYQTAAGKVIPGFDEAVIGANRSSVVTTMIPPEKAYGTDPELHPLGNQTLHFRIKVKSII